MLKLFKNITICLIILSNKINNTFGYNNILYNLPNNKKLISISPGGYKGFYELGVLSYIKENYDMSEYIFSGASAGSWNALFASYKGNTSELFDIIDIRNFKKGISLYDLQHMLKLRILNKLTKYDFELNKLYIGVTAFNKSFFPTTHIFSDFIDLEDAINCCIASSHIPFITGNLFNIYHGIYAFDGGFSKYPYIDIIKPVLHITPDIWLDEKDRLHGFTKIMQLLTIFNKNFDFYKLYKLGYYESSLKKDILDKLFIPFHT